MATIPVLELEGSPYEIGFQHGEKARNQIHHNVDLYFRRFKNEAAVEPEEALARAETYLQSIEVSEKEYAAAMQGVAEGSGHSLLEIAAINVRYEILYSEYNKMGLIGGLSGLARGSGCTALAIDPHRSEDGHLYLAQNWDWIPEVATLVLRIKRKNSSSMLCFTEAGVVGGKIGLNSRGLGLLINGIVSNQDSWTRVSTPFHVRCWRILRSSSLEAAVKNVNEGVRPCSGNFLLGQVEEGNFPKILDIEAAPEVTRVMEPEEGFLVHTNHFLQPSLLGVYHSLPDEQHNSQHRYMKACKLVKEMIRSGKVNLESIISVLANHDGQAKSICKHREVGLPRDMQYETVFSTIMDLNLKRMWFAAGPPCQNKFQSVGLA